MEVPLTITVPTGCWLRRVDNRDDTACYPILAFGLEDGVLVIWSDGTHRLEGKNEIFPASNWEVWSELGSP